MHLPGWTNETYKTRLLDRHNIPVLKVQIFKPTDEAIDHYTVITLKTLNSDNDVFLLLFYNFCLEITRDYP